MSRVQEVDNGENRSHRVDMKTIGAAEFKAHCLQLMDEVGPEGIVITKRQTGGETHAGGWAAKHEGVHRDPRGTGIHRWKRDLSTANARDDWTGEDQEEK